MLLTVLVALQLVIAGCIKTPPTTSAVKDFHKLQYCEYFIDTTEAKLEDLSDDVLAKEEDLKDELKDLQDAKADDDPERIEEAQQQANAINDILREAREDLKTLNPYYKNLIQNCKDYDQTESEEICLSFLRDAKAKINEEMKYLPQMQGDLADLQSDIESEDEGTEKHGELEQAILNKKRETVDAQKEIEILTDILEDLRMKCGVEG